MLGKKIRKRKRIIVFVWILFIFVTLGASFFGALETLAVTEENSLLTGLKAAKTTLPDIIESEANLRYEYADAKKSRTAILPLLVQMEAEEEVLSDADLAHYTKLLGGKTSMIIDGDGVVVSAYRTKLKKVDGKELKAIKTSAAEDKNPLKDYFKEIILTYPDTKSAYQYSMIEKMGTDHYLIIG